MLELVQFFDVYDFPELPVVLLNCGHQSVTSGNYRFDGRTRRDIRDCEVAIWQYTISGRGCIDFGGEREVSDIMYFATAIPESEGTP